MASALTIESHELRSKGVGASEVAALVGLDPYSTALDVYMRKLGLVEDVATVHTKRGNYLEPSLRAWASDIIGHDFRPVSSTLTHPDHPHVRATPDGVASDATGAIRAVLELKAPGPRTFHEWGEGDEAPARYVCQVAQQMAVTGADVGYLAAFLGEDLRVYRFDRDPELERELVQACETFWVKHIVPREPPPVDGRRGGEAWLAQRFPEAARATMLRADGETEGLMLRLRDVRAAQSAAEAERDLLEQRLKAVIGDATGLESPAAGRVTWKGVKGRSTVDWQAYARALGGTDDGAKAHTKTGAAYRRFLFTPSK